MNSGYMFKPRIAENDSGRIEASSPQAQARRAQREIELLGHEVQRLYMITEAMWLLLKQHTDFSEEQLKDIVNEIDLKDGVRSHLAPASEVRQCSSCGRTISIRHTSCIFCGEFICVK